ncbi:MAG: DUF885 domain-containing protein [Actinomadura sp.]
MSALDDLADRYVDEFAALDPCVATIIGVAGQESRLTDYSPDGFAARAELAGRTLTALNATPAESDTDRIGAAVLRERLEVELELAAAGIPDADLNPFSGPLLCLWYAITLLNQGAETRWEAVCDGVRALPGTLAGLRQSVARARQDGRVAARRQIDLSARQAEQFTEILTGLSAQYSARNGDGPLRARLDEAVRAANAALTDFGRFLAENLAPSAPDRDALGRDRYALGARDSLGTRLDLEETYAWGWEELARIETEMRATAARLMPGESVPAVLAALNADPAHRVTGADAFRGWIQELADRTIAELDGVRFDIPDGLRRIDCRIPETGGGIYYAPPTEDLSRPGTMWWSLPDPAADVITWGAPAVMFHEGAPGHHLQLGSTVLNTSGLNRFQRFSCVLHQGHSEGWGLYAERLMAELGHYADPAHLMGMLAGGQQVRAARVILDIGLHLELPIPRGTGFHEGERWTRELGVEFLRDHCGPGNESSVAFEIDRYLCWPAQAIAYKVGERVWMEAREAVRRRQGAAFDLKAFHKQALDLGPMGLDLLRTELTRDLADGPGILEARPEH